MRPALPLLVSILTVPFNAPAQKDPVRQRSIMLNVSPASLIDIVDGPSLRLGTEYYPDRRFGLFGDARGYIYIPSNSGFPDKSEVRGYGFNAGIKYYLRRKLGTTGSVERSYIALQYVYKNQAYSRKDSLITGASPIHTNEKYHLHQYVTCFLLTYGSTAYYIGDRLTTDAYVGAGVKMVHGTSDLPPDKKVYYYHDWTTNTTFVPNTATGYCIYPTLALGIKLGYRYRLPVRALTK